MKLKILKYGDPRLLIKGSNIKHFDENIKSLAKNMIDTMHYVKGLGLAAQQVGYSLNMFVIDLNAAGYINYYLHNGVRVCLKNISPLIIINPIIIFKSMNMHYEYEGCLSFPNIRANILRPSIIGIKYQDINQNFNTFFCDGYLGHCLLHEYDHINGILFINRINNINYNYSN